MKWIVVGLVLYFLLRPPASIGKAPRWGVNDGAIEGGYTG